MPVGARELLQIRGPFACLGDHGRYSVAIRPETRLPLKFAPGLRVRHAHRCVRGERGHIGDDETQQPSRNPKGAGAPRLAAIVVNTSRQVAG
jgi:hypothetical protein